MAISMALKNWILVGWGMQFVIHQIPGISFQKPDHSNQIKKKKGRNQIMITVPFYD